MGALAKYLKNEVEQLRAEMTRRQDNLEEWKAAVHRLYDQLENWLREADNGLGILGVNRDSTKQTVSEPRLGHYDANIMWVTLGGAIGERNAIIVPKARYVAAVIRPLGREPKRADGMVQINDGSTPEYYLFRWKTDSGDEWFIQSVSAWNAAREYGGVEPLDRDRFEAAILNILQ